MKTLRLLPILLAISIPSLTAEEQPAAENPFKSTDAVYQLAPLQALLAGVYEGQTKLGDLMAMGDFGMGTVNPLDGEMIIVDGIAYRAAADGAINILPPETRIPFGQIKKFGEDKRADLGLVTSYDDLCKQLDALIESQNSLYAIRIDGKFDYLKTRSIPGQKPPFQPLPAILGEQVVHEAENVEGTMVIYKYPKYLSSSNVAGYHIHYVNKARPRGGHVLDVRATTLTAILDEAKLLSLVIPQDAAFESADLSTGGGSAPANVLRGTK